MKPARPRAGTATRGRSPSHGPSQHLSLAPASGTAGPSILLEAIHARVDTPGLHDSHLLKRDPPAGPGAGRGPAAGIRLPPAQAAPGGWLGHQAAPPLSPHARPPPGHAPARNPPLPAPPGP